eukprot:scaffold189257_cov14-Tisochrysis_lutea.AAC.1
MKDKPGNERRTLIIFIDKSLSLEKGRNWSAVSLQACAETSRPERACFSLVSSVTDACSPSLKESLRDRLSEGRACACPFIVCSQLSRKKEPRRQRTLFDIDEGKGDALAQES